MGIDIVDIAMAIERTFDIRMETGDMEFLVYEGDVQVGDLYILILKKLHVRDAARFDFRLNRQLWQDVQQALHLATGTPFDEVQLQTPLVELLPRPTRLERWNAFRNALPYELPELEYPVFVPIAGMFVSVLMLVIEQVRIWQNPVAKCFWPLLGIVGVWMMVEAYFKTLRLMARFRTRLPSRWRTVKDLCRAMLKLNFANASNAALLEAIDLNTLLAEKRCLEVWQELRSLLSNSLGIPPDMITFESKLIADLRAY